MVEELTFGQVDTFLSVLNTDYRNEWSDRVFGRENRKFVLSWISVSRYLRNISAHHSRFYGKKYIVLPRLKKEDMKQYGVTNGDKNTLFVALLVLKSLLSFHSLQVQSEWNLFMDNLEEIFEDKSPNLLYFMTLYNIFKDFIGELNEEEIIKTKTGFKDTLVWNKLYNFQKDGVLGAIDKLEKYNGCIIAYSVGLGKTFEALAVIKYYELRNDRVLVLAPKKLRENWTLYTINDKRNVLSNDRFNLSSKLLADIESLHL